MFSFHCDRWEQAEYDLKSGFTEHTNLSDIHHKQYSKFTLLKQSLFQLGVPLKTPSPKVPRFWDLGEAGRGVTKASSNVGWVERLSHSLKSTSPT